MEMSTVVRKGDTENTRDTVRHLEQTLINRHIKIHL